ncbi:MAG: DNA polymerase III subunit gamma/tau, partial [Dehalococcoidales bacterium]|nr:DNA polymerase III subunit gamma/tau [Dehalococcoidales bacterium]
KWRPQTLADVAGQEHVTRTLLNALSSGHVSHAYLFCGPRGTGKTSTGRILSKAVNCTSNGKGEPCNKCEMCISITEGRAMDVIEIDAASNRGIDEIRNLRERVNYAPGNAKFKVYIIDEFHMLTKEASNALLKTLEEPPSSVIFILATTEAHKVLPTIMSRCQRFDFHRISQTVITDKLKQICDSEGITIDREALNVLAKNATGSLRDAENLLEKLYTHYGSDINLNQVRDMLGITGNERIKVLVEYIMGSNITAGIQTINAIKDDGFDLKQLNRELIAYLRGLLLLKTGYNSDLDFTPEEMTLLAELAERSTVEQILKAIKTFGKLELNLDSYSTLPLELAIVDCSLANSAPAGGQPAISYSQQAKDTSESIVSKKKSLKQQPPIVTDPDVNKKAETKADLNKKESAEEEIADPIVKNKDINEYSNKLDYLIDNWKNVIEQAPDNVKRSPALAILRSAGVKPIAFDDKVVVLSFRFPVHKDKIEQAENNKITAKIIGNFIGHQCEVRCVYEPEENHLVHELQKMGGQIVEVEEKWT